MKRQWKVKEKAVECQGKAVEGQGKAVEGQGKAVEKVKERQWKVKERQCRTDIVHQENVVPAVGVGVHDPGGDLSHEHPRPVREEVFERAVLEHLQPHLETPPDDGLLDVDVRTLDMELHVDQLFDDHVGKDRLSEPGGSACCYWNC